MMDNPEEALGEALRREISRSLRRHTELQSRLIGYEIAVTAILGALDRTGALPLSSAKSAIDAAATEIAAASPSSEALTVLRQLSDRLQPSELLSTWIAGTGAESQHMRLS
jgi:hypothetical protein